MTKILKNVFLTKFYPDNFKNRLIIQQKRTPFTKKG